MSPAAARSASASTRCMFSSTDAIGPGRVGRRVAFRVARRARAPAEPARDGRRRDSWPRRRPRIRTTRARTRRASADASRRRCRAEQLVLARTVTPDDVDGRNARRRSRCADGPARARPRTFPPVASARAHSHSTRPSNSSCDSGRAAAAARAPVRLHHQHQRTDRDRLAGQHANRVFPDRSLRSRTRVPFALPRSSTSMSPASPRAAEGGAGRLRVVQLDVDAVAAARPRSPRRARGRRTSRTPWVPITSK
jgi:hypothetical protein